MGHLKTWKASGFNLPAAGLPGLGNLLPHSNGEDEPDRSLEPVVGEQVQQKQHSGSSSTVGIAPTANWHTITVSHTLPISQAASCW